MEVLEACFAFAPSASFSFFFFSFHRLLLVDAVRMGESVKSILLESDEYSPNSKPHSLPALHWPGLFAAALKTKGPEWIEDRLISLFWDAQWRYKMYTQAHYHSVSMMYTLLS